LQLLREALQQGAVALVVALVIICDAGGSEAQQTLDPGLAAH
jgi:hypothetical protein